jgi:hypothetical protein
VAKSEHGYNTSLKRLRVASRQNRSALISQVPLMTTIFMGNHHEHAGHLNKGGSGLRLHQGIGASDEAVNRR